MHIESLKYSILLVRFSIVSRIVLLSSDRVYSPLLLVFLQSYDDWCFLQTHPEMRHMNCFSAPITSASKKKSKSQLFLYIVTSVVLPI